MKRYYEREVMATVRAIVRAEKKSRATIYFRLTDGRGMKIYYKSELKIDPQLWDEKNQAIKIQKINSYTPEERAQFKKDIADLANVIFKVYNSEQNRELKTTNWLQKEVNNILFPSQPQQVEETKESFFGEWDVFINKRRLSDVRIRNYDVVQRALMRFEKYKSKESLKPYNLSFETTAPETLREIEVFLRSENKIVEQYPEIYSEVKKSRKKVEPRGPNTISGMFIKIRTFFIWANNEGKTTNNPFKNFKIPSAVYGTPYYITIDERNQLYNTDLSAKPTVAIQRDIFVFQCFIGCRVADLIQLTKNNVEGNAIEYIQRKTKEGRPVTLRVPLNPIAKEIIDRYSECEGDKLLPFITPQKYNEAIKVAFTEAKLNRIVTIINPTNREEDHLPLNKIASSHLARRCFIGNLYKQVKDPNLISALSGHIEGSRAFNRYRDIDEETKQDLVNLLT